MMTCCWLEGEDWGRRGSWSWRVWKVVLMRLREGRGQRRRMKMIQISMNPHMTRATNNTGMRSQGTPPCIEVEEIKHMSTITTSRQSNFPKLIRIPKKNTRHPARAQAQGKAVAPPTKRGDKSLTAKFNSPNWTRSLISKNRRKQQQEATKGTTGKHLDQAKEVEQGRCLTWTSRW